MEPSQNYSFSYLTLQTRHDTIHIYIHIFTIYFTKRNETKKTGIQYRNTNFSKKKKEHEIDIEPNTYVKGRGRASLSGNRVSPRAKNLRSIVKISKNHRSLSQYWEECVCFARGFMQTVRVATITLSEFIVFSGLARDQEIVDGKLPPRWDGNSFGTGLVVKTSLKLDF